MATDGVSPDQIRATVKATLQASDRVTAIVPAASILVGRVPPLADDSLPNIIIYLHNESMTFAGAGLSGTCGLPTMEVTSDVVVEAYLSDATDAALEDALDVSQTIVDALLTDATFMAMFFRVAAIKIDNDTRSMGAKKRIGVTQITLSCVHLRGWYSL